MPKHGPQTLLLRLFGASLLVLGLTSCERKSTHTIMDLPCGALKLRFEERVSDTFETTSWSEALLLDRGSGWIEVDRSSAYGSYDPVSYSRLLPASLGLQTFPFDDRRPQANPLSRPRWGVFVSPTIVSRAEYDAIASCLGKSVAAVDRAFATPRNDKDLGLNRESQASRRPQLTSIIYSTREREFYGCGAKTLGSRWECEGGKGYVKTVIDNQQGQFLLCTTEAPPHRTAGSTTVQGMVLGRISTDQKAVFLTPPDKASFEYRTLLSDKDPQAYYASCRDASGKGFLNVFEPTDEASNKIKGRGSALFEAGRYQEALKVYREAMGEGAKESTSSAWAHREAGTCLERLEREKEATAEYRKAVELDPDDPENQFWLANSLIGLNDKEAVEQFRKDIRLEPDNARAFIGLGTALYNRSRYAEAVEAFDTAAKLCATCLSDDSRSVYEKSKHRAGR